FPIVLARGQHEKEDHADDGRHDQHATANGHAKNEDKIAALADRPLPTRTPDRRLIVRFLDRLLLAPPPNRPLIIYDFEIWFIALARPGRLLIFDNFEILLRALWPPGGLFFLHN